MTSPDASMDDARLMSWENFRANFIDEGIAVDVPVAGDPPITIFAEPSGRAVGLRTPVPPGTIAPRSSVSAVQIEVYGGFLRIRTSDFGLYQPFFAFLLDVSNRIQLDGKPPGAAFNEALASWRRMLIPSSAMDIDQQLGLSGELWVVERLVRATGTGAIAAWTGPDKDAHDFRLSDSELEVKTTSGKQRRHIVSRLDQLKPSPTMDLYIVSLQMAAAGLSEGWTLADQVATIRALCSSDVTASDLLERKLSDSGWRNDDAPLYPLRRRLRSPALLVPVDQSCPRIVPETLTATLGLSAERVDDVRYRIDVGGLGVFDGSPNFAEIIPDTKGQA